MVYPSPCYYYLGPGKSEAGLSWWLLCRILKRAIPIGRERERERETRNKERDREERREADIVLGSLGVSRCWYRNFHIHASLEHSLGARQYIYSLSLASELLLSSMSPVPSLSSSLPSSSPLVAFSHFLHVHASVHFIAFL